MLMDLFFAAADVQRKQRIHFHRFMQDAHARIFAWRRANPDGDDPIPPLADAIAAEAALLCFDEFQVNDIADAMILGRLFQALFERGVVVVATSNTLPDDLFKGQPGRDAFLPFIALIKRRLDVLVMDAGRDFRRDRLRGMPTWYVPADARADRALDAAFAELTGDAEPREPETLMVMGRKFVVPLAAAGVARFDFSALCGTALGRRRLPGAGDAFSHADPGRHPASVARQLRRGAPLHRPDRCAVRTSREAASRRPRRAGSALSSAARTPGVRTHRLAAGGDAKPGLAGAAAPGMIGRNVLITCIGRSVDLSGRVRRAMPDAPVAHPIVGLDRRWVSAFRELAEAGRSLQALDTSLDAPFPAGCRREAFRRRPAPSSRPCRIWGHHTAWRDKSDTDATVRSDMCVWHFVRGDLQWFYRWKMPSGSWTVLWQRRES